MVVNTCKGLEHLLMSTAVQVDLLGCRINVDEAAVIEQYSNSPPFYWNKMFSKVLHVSVYVVFKTCEDSCALDTLT